MNGEDECSSFQMKVESVVKGIWVVIMHGSWHFSVREHTKIVARKARFVLISKILRKFFGPEVGE